MYTYTYINTNMYAYTIIYSTSDICNYVGQATKILKYISIYARKLHWLPMEEQIQFLFGQSANIHQRVLMNVGMRYESAWLRIIILSVQKIYRFLASAHSCELIGLFTLWTLPLGTVFL